MGNYDDFKKTPGDHLRVAEQELLRLGHRTNLSAAESIAYASALVALANAQMTGSLRR